MPQLTQGPLRYLRGAVLGVFVGSVALLGHAAGHGTVALIPALLVLGLAVAASAAVTGRVLRPAVLAPFVAVCQLGAHWLLSSHGAHASGAAPHHAGVTAVGGSAGRVWAAHPRVALDPGPLPVSSWWPHLDTGMVVGHTVAAVIIVGLMWRSDAALAAFLRALHRALDVVLGGGCPAAPGAVVGRASGPDVGQAPAPSRDLAHPSPTRHRGPPALSAFC